MMSYDDWFFYVSVAYLLVLIAAAIAAVVLWRLNDANELGAANRPKRVYANVTTLSLGMVGAFASVVLFFLSQHANQEAAKKTTEAQASADNARARAARATKQAARARRQAAVATERAQTEAVERLKLEKTIAWRRVSSADGEAGSEILKKTSGKINIRIMLGDIETTGFGFQIAQIFNEAGWTINISFPQIVGDLFADCIIKGQPGEKRDAVESAFRSLQIGFEEGEIPRFSMFYGTVGDDADIDVLIVPKLPKEFEEAVRASKVNR